MLDLSLPDSQGIETFDKLHDAAPDIPILVLGGDDDEALAEQAVARGAQDYLLPSHLNAYSLQRALRNAIERKMSRMHYTWKKNAPWSPSTPLVTPFSAPTFPADITYLNRVAEA